MITLDSPVASVLGDKKGKRSKIVEGLGIETVRDLMRHFPRRYLKTGRAHQGRRPHRRPDADRRRRDRPQRGQDLPRPADRPTGVPPGDRAPHRRSEPEDDVLRQAEGRLRVAGPASERRPQGRVHRQGQPVPRRVAAHQPLDGAVRHRRRRGGRHCRGPRRPVSPLPPDQGRRALGHPARGHLRAHRPRRHPGDVARLGPAGLRRPRPPHRLRLDPRARRLRAGAPRPAPVPLRGGPGHPAGPGPTPARGPGHGGGGALGR